MITSDRFFALTCIAVAALLAGCTSNAATRRFVTDPLNTTEPAAAPARGGTPAPCGLWRPVDPGDEPDRYAFLPTPEMEEVGLAGPPVEWSRVRDVATERVPWITSANVVLTFRIDGMSPARAGDALYVVDDRLILYRVRPSRTPGRWRVDGTLGEDEARRLERILAGAIECARLDGT